jgi:hypothetical protein
MCTTGCLEAGGEGCAKAGGTASQIVGGVGQAHQAARCEAHLQLCQTKQLLAHQHSKELLLNNVTSIFYPPLLFVRSGIRTGKCPDPG